MPPDAVTGLRFGPYRVVRTLGQGAMGAVYLALHEHSGDAVALKVMALASGLSGSALDEARSRFLTEAEPMRRLAHPDIVALRGAGETNGTGWLAMELMTGTSLERYTRPARLLPEPVVLGLGERMARALHHAHGLGVVHRDVKPSNVMVDWATGQLKLSDFGLARLADAERTRTGLVLGSPAYMAPEQLAGDAPTPRTDLYALGVTLFQLLTGRLPHDEPSLGALLRSVATEPAPDLRSLRPELSPACAAVIAQLLEKQPDQRPRDALQAAEALRGLQAPP